MKNNKLRLSLYLLAVALMLFTAAPINSSHAQSMPKEGTPDAGSKKLLYTLPLQPKNESRMTIGNFQIAYYDDGSVELSSESDYSAYSAPYAYQFEVDTSNATYSSQPISPEEDMPTYEDAAYNIPPEYNPGDEGGVGGGGREEEGGEDPMSGERRQYVVSRWGGRIRVQTYDPAFLRLTETSNYLEWSVNHDGTVRWDLRRHGCWAANPSPLNTHWYVRYCSANWPMYNWNSTTVTSLVSGGYYNWDFGSISRATYVDQSSRIEALNNGYFRYSWRHADSGEFSTFIYGRVRLN